MPPSPSLHQWIFSSLDVLLVAFNHAVFAFSRLSLQLLEQLNVASLSRPTVFFQCYSLVLLCFGQINDDDDDDIDDISTCAHRTKLLYTGTRRFQFDGLNSLQYRLVHVADMPLYTHVLVDIGKPPRGF